MHISVSLCVSPDAYRATWHAIGEDGPTGQEAQRRYIRTLEESVGYDRYLHCSPFVQSLLSPLLLIVEMMMTVAVGYHGRFYPVISDGHPNHTLFLLHSTIYYE